MWLLLLGCDLLIWWLHSAKLVTRIQPKRNIVLSYAVYASVCCSNFRVCVGIRENIYNGRYGSQATHHMPWNRLASRDNLNNCERKETKGKKNKWMFWAEMSEKGFFLNGRQRGKYVKHRKSNISPHLLCRLGWLSNLSLHNLLKFYSGAYRWSNDDFTDFSN